MKRLFASLIVPLLMMALMSFTPSNAQEHQVRGSDSTMVNLKFSPAQIVVSDNRTVDGITSIIQENTNSNTKIAESISTIADAMLSISQERRCASLMDRITQQTGLSVTEVTKILHKKRVWDMTFYTLFLIFSLYVLFGIAKNSFFAPMVSVKEWTIRTMSGLLYLSLLYLIYLMISVLVNGAQYSIIHSIIKTAPG